MAELNKVERYEWDALPESVPIRMVPLSAMAVDNTYQRDRLSETNIMAMARHWDHAACGALVTSLRDDGLYYVVDGNHRRLAAERRGDIRALPCRIVSGLTIADEAALFRKLNMVRVRVDTYCRYRSALVGGDPCVAACDAMVTSLGLRVRQGDERNCIAFPEALMRAWKVDHEATRAALEVARLMIGPDANICKELFVGCFYVLRRADHARVRELAAPVFQRGGRPVMLHAIRETTMLMGMTRAHERVCGAAVLRVLNYRRKSPLALTEELTA